MNGGRVVKAIIWAFVAALFFLSDTQSHAANPAPKSAAVQLSAGSQIRRTNLVGETNAQLAAGPDAVPEAPGAQVFSAEDIIHLFDGSIFSQSLLSENHIAKWTNDIHVALVPDQGVSPELMQSLLGSIMQFRDRTQVKISISNTAFNFVVILSSDIAKSVSNHQMILRPFFKSDASFASFVENIKPPDRRCQGHAMLRPDYSIASYVLVVSTLPDDVSGSVGQCINGMITVGMAFYPAEQNLEESVSIDKGHSSGPQSPIYSKALEILYDPRMPLGATREIADKAVMEIMRDKQ